MSDIIRWTIKNIILYLIIGALLLFYIRNNDGDGLENFFYFIYVIVFLFITISTTLVIGITTYQEHKVRDLIRRILSENNNIVEEYKMGKQESLNILIEKVLIASKGGFDYCFIEKVIKEQLESSNGNS